MNLNDSLNQSLSIRDCLEKKIQIWLHLKSLKNHPFIEQKNKTLLSSSLRELFSDPRLDAGKSGRGTYMDIEHYLTRHIGPLAGQLQLGRSRNDTDQYVLRTLSMLMCRKFIASINNIACILKSKQSQEPEVIIPYFTQNQPASLTTSTTFYSSAYTHVSRSLLLLKSQIRILRHSRTIGSSVGSGSFVALQWERSIPHISPTTPFSDVSSYSDLSAISQSLLSTLSSLGQIINLIKVYADSSSSIHLSDSFGKSSAIPGKANLFRVERYCHTLVELHSLHQTFLFAVARSPMTNDYWCKLAYRTFLDACFERIPSMLLDWSRTLESFRFCQSSIPDSFYKLYAAEITAVQSNDRNFRSCYEDFSEPSRAVPDKLKAIIHRRLIQSP